MAQTVHEESPELQFGRDQLALKGLSTDVERRKYDTRITRDHELSIWQRVNSEFDSFESVHHRFWWARHTGKALAVLLYYARYPADVQYQNLKFFAEAVAPHLGVSPELVEESETPIWPSFMTDDGTPAEISWDWGTTDSAPTIRYSLEPIGLHAGTSVDPGNLTAGPAFQERLERSLPTMRLEWFHHFQAFFHMHNNVDKGEFHADPGDHNSSIFYAFDCSETDITPKVYFFPKSRAKASGKSSLDVLFQAMRTAPHVKEGNFKAGDILHAFCSSVDSKLLEHEMLAIDLIDPLRSRLKIYFRCRETTFNSVINIMTLGGRIQNPKLYEGLVDLHQLWNALFGVSAVDQPLRAVEHRTSGILYNVEFRLGEELPVAKIYLPVRHYSASDEAVIRGLNDYFQGRQRGKYMPDYIKAMSTLFTPQSMRENAGVQTYVGYAIRPDGALRVVSYFKPQVPVHLFEYEGGS